MKYNTKTQSEEVAQSDAGTISLIFFGQCLFYLCNLIPKPLRHLLHNVIHPMRQYHLTLSRQVELFICLDSYMVPLHVGAENRNRDVSPR